MQKYYPQLLILSFSLLASSYAVANNQCVQIQNQAIQAYKQNNLPLLHSLKQQIHHSSRDCNPNQKIHVERQLAYAMYNNLANKRVQGQALVIGMRKIEQQNDSFWPALVALAEHYHDVKNFNQSASYYSKAVDAINDETKTLQADVPPPHIIQKLVKTSELDLLAADNPPPPSKADADGLMGFKVKSVRATRKQLPIHFDFGRKHLSGNDLRYAKRLYKALHKKGDPNIRLIGHTDPVGPDGPNLLLSKGRAATVREYLEKRGYKGNIVSTGKGERNPLYDPRGNAIRHYGKKRWHRMLRRVEIIIY